jgi:aldehyde dehydrogenase
MLLAIADAVEANLDRIALMETVDNGKPIRETTFADLPLVIDHFRYFAGVLRADEGTFAELDQHTMSIHVHEPLGVVGCIVPWNFPLLMATWKLAPALAAGNTIVLKPAEQTPISIAAFMDIVKDILPPGVVNVVQGFGEEAGAALATSDRIAKLAFTGETSTGQLILSATAKNIIPVTMELGGKSPNIFFESVMAQDDAFFDKCLEGAASFSLNQGEVCTCPSRILVQESIADAFIERLNERVGKIIVGDPLDMATQIGAQASEEQYRKIQSYFEIGRQEGAEVLTGGEVAQVHDGGYYIKPTVFKGTNTMRVFQEEIFGPVASLTTFKTAEEAIEIANDTTYGLGAGVFTRDAHQAYIVPRAIKAGRVWVNNYHNYPAHAAFGGYKKSGFGRETHKMMLDHYRQTKNMLVSYDMNGPGFF